MKDFIDVRRITKQYETAKALNNVSLTIPEGSLTAIVGKSGCGKTTLLNMIGGLDTPSCGEVYVTGKCITAMKERELSRFRADSIGFVFSFSISSLNLPPPKTFFCRRCFHANRSTGSTIPV